MKNKCASLFLWLALSLPFLVVSLPLLAAETLGKVDITAALEKAEQLRSANPAEFISILATIEPDFENLNIDQKYFFTYLNGYKFALEGDFQRAISSYKHVFSSSQNNKMKHRAVISLINIYALRREWLSAFYFLEHIQSESEAVDDFQLRHNGWIAAAIFYNELGLYDLALFNVRKLEDEGITDRNLCFARSIKLKARGALGKEPVDAAEYEEASSHCRELNENIVASVIDIERASKMVEMGHFERVTAFLLAKLNEIESGGYKLTRLGAYSLLARSFLAMEEFDQAKGYAEKVIEIGQPGSNLKLVVEAMKSLYLIGVKQNNLTEAFAFLERLREAENLLAREEKSKQFAIEMAKYRTIEKDNRIALLDKQNKILQLESELAKDSVIYNRWLIILLLLLVAILTMWVFYVRRSQRKLRYMAEYDSLTDVYNRACFTESAETVLSYYSKSERVACLLLFDLDNFKKINDQFGHVTGDTALKESVRACKSCIRKIDIFGRVGGEEFAILLPGCDPQQAFRLAEACRKKISSTEIKTESGNLKLTASFGISSTSDSGYLLKDLSAHADDAMYIAKKNGRDQTHIYHPG